jgi:phosphoribosylanthranilate isomerase
VRETVTRIKICGVTNREDALFAVEQGADALGFIFVPQTPRFVGEREDLAEMLRSVPPFVTRTAICTTAETLPVGLLDRLDAVQFYDPDFPTVTGKVMVQSFRIKDEASLDLIAEALRIRRPQAIHLDTYHKDKMGGSGETFNWELALAAKARFDLPLILSGGLTPENVLEAIRTVQPYAVDVSSGVEAEPGRKDPARIRAFCRAVHAADALRAISRAG